MTISNLIYGTTVSVYEALCCEGVGGKGGTAPWYWT